jgi:carbon-monoxide dehydrogenase large subunit
MTLTQLNAFVLAARLVPVAAGRPAAFVNAVLNAIEGTAARDIDMPLLPDRAREDLTRRRDACGAPPVRTED